MAAIRVRCEVQNGYVHVQLVHEPPKISPGNFDNSRLQLRFSDNLSVQSFICNTVLEIYYCPGDILLDHSFTEYSRQELQFLIDCMTHVTGKVRR
jgi:hypothetical protein